MPKGQFILSRRAQAANLIRQEVYALQRALKALRETDKPKNKYMKVAKPAQGPKGAPKGTKGA